MYLSTFKARYIFVNFQYATDGSNLLLITGPNMVSHAEINCTFSFILELPCILLSVVLFAHRVENPHT